MKIPGLSALARTGMDDLVRMRQEWRSLLPAGFSPPEHEDNAAATGLLTPVAAFGANPGSLRMLAYVPPGLPAGAPLVVVLHGCQQTASGIDAGTGWSTLAQRHGFAVLAPEQQRANNTNCCFNWFAPEDITRGHGEVASIRAMVAHMQLVHGTSRHRTFVTGLSAGGAMTAALLATYPDAFAAGAVIAGLPYGCADNVGEALAAMRHCPDRSPAAWGATVRDAAPGSTRPIVSIWHGDADATVTIRAATALAAQWCDVHGLSGPPREDTLDGAARRQWRDPAGVVRVEQVIVPGLHHGVPITPGEAGDRGVGHPAPYVLEAAISSTYHIAKGWGLLT